jgi:4'-phosphopantetheinyl transferase
VKDLLDLGILSELQNCLQEPSLSFSVSRDWGSDCDGYREKIRAGIAALSPTDSSISHTQGLGGFAAILGAENRKIGFDIEVIARVTPQIAGRVRTTADELSLAPSPAHLWVAKEAAFKALKGPQQPKLISEIHIVDWQKTKSQFETFRVTGLNSRGAVFIQSSFAFGVFIFS